MLLGSEGFRARVTDSGTDYILDLSEEAETDIETILSKTGEKWDEKQIPIYADKRSRLPSAYRCCPVGSHAVFYRVLGNSVRVDRILHGRMSPAKHL